MLMTPPLKWWGGKHYLAKNIIRLMPRHLHYVEPYAGGLAVLLEKDPFDPLLCWGEKGYEQGVSEVVNDIHCELTNFWRATARRDVFRFPAANRSHAFLADRVGRRQYPTASCERPRC